MDQPNRIGAICPVACQAHSRWLAVGGTQLLLGHLSPLPSSCPWVLCFLSLGLFPPFIGASPPTASWESVPGRYFSAASHTWGLPRWHSGKESACQCRRYKRLGFDPWVGKIPWRRKWQPTPVFLPGEFHGQKSLVVYSPWGHRIRHDWAHTLQQLCIPENVFYPNRTDGLAKYRILDLQPSFLRI